MTDSEAHYHNVCAQILEVEKSQFFGKPCYKIGKKAFVSFFQNEMVFKLDGEDHAEAIALADAHLFDPSGKGRAMKAWVQVPFEHKNEWQRLAQQACDFVASGAK